MIKNMRDLSEAARNAGISLRKGCLIRSASLHQASSEELRGISAIIDLRTHTEAERMPDRAAEWVSFYHIPIFDEAAVGITRENTLSEVPDMKRLYRIMLEQPVSRSHLHEVLRLISVHDYSKGAILWHCTAGKDRCGVVSAIVLETLGVSRNLIMRDYLRSNDSCAFEGDAAYRQLISKGQPEALAQAVRNAYLAKPEYLQAAFDAYDRNPLCFPNSEKFRRAVLLQRFL